MIFLLYRVLQGLASPALLVYFLWRGLRDKRYFATLDERLGTLPSSWKQTAAGAIWLHAVSVGEIIAAIPLLAALRQARPRIKIFVSTTTLAGHQTADTRLTGLADGVFYCPLDTAWCVRRVLRHLRPSLVLIMETEIWPNLFREVTRTDAGLMILNGRISDRALPRYRKFSAAFRPVLRLCDQILVQSDEMARRYITAGAAPEQVTAAGNLKYDFTPAGQPPAPPVRAFVEASPAPLWIAASTSADDHAEEEDAVLHAQTQLPGWRLILVPRKPERFEHVARKLTAANLSWTRRTQLDNPSADILLLDTVGELSSLFPLADVVFMGGSLVEKGGHNILEPAACGKPVIAGPHMENFQDIADHFEARNAWLPIPDGSHLASAILQAHRDNTLGPAAKAAADEKRGATARTLTALLSLYDSRLPRFRPPQPLFAIEWFLAQLWKYGSQLDRNSKRTRTRRLPVPVISVGNITAGGTGKTPVTIELLRHLPNSGLLMCGYGRDARKPVVLPNSQTRLPLSHTGDEAQLYQGLIDIPIGIAADRFEAGELLLRQVQPERLLLDDGFQHLQLARDFDLVLVDALHPFGDGELLPLGRLREPLEGLARASAFLITRSDEVPCVAAIEHVLRRYNPAAPIYRAKTVPAAWRTFGGRPASQEEVSDGPAIAFCGLGNPHSFWRSLGQLGLAPREQISFDDHHRYSPVELRRLVRHATDIGCEILLTTAKDAVNLCEGCEGLIQPLRCYWLEIGVEIEGLEQLLQQIADTIRCWRKI